MGRAPPYPQRSAKPVLKPEAAAVRPIAQALARINASRQTPARWPAAAASRVRIPPARCSDGPRDKPQPYPRNLHIDNRASQPPLPQSARSRPHAPISEAPHCGTTDQASPITASRQSICASTCTIFTPCPANPPERESATESSPPINTGTAPRAHCATASAIRSGRLRAASRARRSPTIANNRHAVARFGPPNQSLKCAGICGRIVGCCACPKGAGPTLRQ